MIKALFARLKQGYRTMSFPKGEPPVLPPRYLGRLKVIPDKCDPNCRLCVDSCPFSALSKDSKIAVDLGRCVFCGKCAEICPKAALVFTQDYRLAVRNRHELILTGDEIKLADQISADIKKIIGRSLALRQVSAGGCNSCEADTNVLTTVGWDLSRFGIQFVASPRHADGLLITGCIPDHMKEALLKTYAAVPSPKIVIAVGSCAISGGPYLDHKECHNGIGKLLPVDLYIPGCPPHPLTILDGLLRLVGKRKI